MHGKKLNLRDITLGSNELRPVTKWQAEFYINYYIKVVRDTSAIHLNLIVIQMKFKQSSYICISRDNESLED